MKIQIDTDNKIIKLESKENLGKLIAVISQMLENWQEYSIDSNTIINWSNPVVIERPCWKPWYERPLWYSSCNTADSLTALKKTIPDSNDNIYDDGHNTTSTKQNYIVNSLNPKIATGVYNIELKD